LASFVRLIEEEDVDNLPDGAYNVLSVTGMQNEHTDHYYLFQCSSYEQNTGKISQIKIYANGVYFRTRTEGGHLPPESLSFSEWQQIGGLSIEERGKLDLIETGGGGDRFLSDDGSYKKFQSIFPNDVATQEDITRINEIIGPYKLGSGSVAVSDCEMLHGYYFQGVLYYLADENWRTFPKKPDCYAWRYG